MNRAMHDEEVAEFTARLLRQQIAAETFRVLLADCPDAKAAGVRTHLAAFLLDASPCKTQRELAAKLGLTRSRVTQMLSRLRREPHFNL